MFEAVIFDWDGTLANTKKILVSAFQKALNEINCKINNTFVERLIGIGSIETFKEILKYKNIRFDNSLLESLVRKKVQFSIELSEDITLFDGSLDLIHSLAGKVKIGLASMNNRAFINFMLQKFDLINLFDIVMTANEITNAKPHPEIFLKSAQKLGIQAAKQARMSCIAVLNAFNQGTDLKKNFPDLIINSFKEKQKILNFIFN